MAFKNLFPPNVASGTAFLKNVSGFGMQSNSSLDSVINDQMGGRCLRVTCDGSVTQQGTYTSQISCLTNTNYTFQTRYIIPTGKTVLMYLHDPLWTCSATKTLIADGTVHIDAVTLLTKSNTTIRCMIITNSAQNVVSYFNKLQVEPGSTATSYQFPGVDLTGNSITSNEAVQNIKLNQELKMFAIASGEQVQNLTVENILQLLQVPSSEYVNNLEICNSIFLEAIESTETVNELIVWIACEFMKCNITMKTPKAILKMKYPR